MATKKKAAPKADSYNPLSDVSFQNAAANVAKAPANTAATIGQLPASTQRIIDINAAAQGMTSQQYLASRGGVNPVTGFYGDAANANLLTDAEYLAARSGTSGLGSGAALNKAYAKKTFDNAIAAIPPKGQSETDVAYNTRVANAKAKAQKDYDDALSGSAGATGGAGETGGTNGTGLGGTEGLLLKQEADRIAEKKRQEGQSAYDILSLEFNQYGLGALIEPLRALVVSGASPAEFSLKLRDTEAYKKRFSANADRIAKGLTALSPAEYIGLEDQYQNIMRNYGLPTSYYAKDSIGTQSGFNQLLANDVSAVELTDRINTAQTRVLNANPEVMTALKAFYPDITNGDILAYSLDPTKALFDIKNKVTAAEIGGAALAQGLTTGMTRAQELAGYGVTKEQAQQGFQTVAQIAPRGGQLASIYNESPYTQATAEAEVFNTAGAAESAAQRKKLTKLEQAQFGGSAGMAGGALSRDRATSQGTYRSAGAGNF